MRRLAIVTVALLMLAACGNGGPAIVRAAKPTTTTLAASCHGGVLPDRGCTPGAINPAVTQATIWQTICVKGWTATVRPPVSVTAPIKRERMAAYGVGRQAPARYELDHLIPLELGGATVAITNLWPEYLAGKQGALTKDGVENRLRAAVCAGKLTLTEAQRRIATDWTVA